MTRTALVIGGTREMRDRPADMGKVSWRVAAGVADAAQPEHAVEGALAAGVKFGPIVFRHMLPNALGPVIVQSTLVVATAIIDAAALSFLGVGSADTRKPDHLSQLDELGVVPFDLVVVNLYPFADTVASGAGIQDCIEKIDIGPKGAVLTLRDNSFPNPGGLVGLIQKNHAFWKIRPDQKIVVSGDWPTAEERLKVAERITADLARVAGA